MTPQETYMKAALRLAKRSAAEGEVPVGCVIVCDGEIVGRGRNRRETKKTALSHAELEAIGKACKKLGGWRLQRCEMYVTLEPCPMCAGAIINARIKTVYYGAADSKAGACGAVIDLFSCGFNHRPEVVRGLMQEECSGVLSDFFRDLRARRKEAVRLRKQASAQSLLSIPGVGAELQLHLHRLGIQTVEQLKGQNPDELFARSCAEQEKAMDRRVLYGYRLAVYYAEHEVREKEKLRWWYWKNHPYPEE